MLAGQRQHEVLDGQLRRGVPLDPVPGHDDRLDPTQRALAGGVGGQARHIGRQLVVDQRDVGPRLHHQHVAVERGEVEQRAIESIAHAALLPRLLSLPQILELGAGPVRDPLGVLDAQRTGEVVPLAVVALGGDGRRLRLGRSRSGPERPIMHWPRSCS